MNLFAPMLPSSFGLTMVLTPLIGKKFHDEGMGRPDGGRAFRGARRRITRSGIFTAKAKGRPKRRGKEDCGRVEPGSYLPGAPTDPDVPNFRTFSPQHPVPLRKDSLS
jgi:hypothetical protein